MVWSPDQSFRSCHLLQTHLTVTTPKKPPNPAKLAMPSSKDCNNWRFNFFFFFFHFLEVISPVWVLPAQQRTKKSPLQLPCAHSPALPAKTGTCPLSASLLSIFALFLVWQRGKTSVGSPGTACNQSPGPLPAYQTAPVFHECPQGRQVMKGAPLARPSLPP